VMAARGYGNDWFLRIFTGLIWGVAFLAAISGIDYGLRGVAYLRQSTSRR